MTENKKMTKVKKKNWRRKTNNFFASPAPDPNSPSDGRRVQRVLRNPGLHHRSLSPRSSLLGKTRRPAHSKQKGFFHFYTFSFFTYENTVNCEISLNSTFSQASYLIGQAKEVCFLKIVLTTNAIKKNVLHSMEALS